MTTESSKIFVQPRTINTLPWNYKEAYMNFRMVIAIMFLILLLAFGIFQEIYLDKVFSQFDSMLEELTNPPTANTISPRQYKSRSGGINSIAKWRCFCPTFR